MSKHNKLQQARATLDEEINKPNPDQVKIKRLKEQIIMLGLGLTGKDIKPF